MTGRRFKYFMVLVAVVLLTGSCVKHTKASRVPVPGVSAILNAPRSRNYQIISTFNPSSSHGSIAVIGDPDRASALGRRYAEFDKFDNITGSAVSDLLPDFSGEEIAVIIDSASFPYEPYVQNREFIDLRENTLRLSILALDSAYVQTSYYDEAAGSKPGSKILVLASPYLAAYGFFDVDSLFTALNADIPVMSPAASALEEALDRKMTTIGIVADSLDVCTSVYDTLFSIVKEHKRVAEGKIFVSTSESSDPERTNLLKIWLDGYKANGGRDAIDMLIVDDGHVAADSLKAGLWEIRNVKDEENYEYAQLLSNDFVIVDAMDCVTEKSFKLMRNRNIFTHNVAYPVLSYFRTRDEGDVVELIKTR